MVDMTSDPVATASGAGLRLWPYLLVLGLLAFYIVTQVQSYLRLSHIPGPRLAAISDLWWIRAAVSGTGHLALADANSKYGTTAPDILFAAKSS